MIKAFHFGFFSSSSSLALYTNPNINSQQSFLFLTNLLVRSFQYTSKFEEEKKILGFKDISLFFKEAMEEEGVHRKKRGVGGLGGRQRGRGRGRGEG